LLVNATPYSNASSAGGLRANSGLDVYSLVTVPRMSSYYST
jgi:hypothetical protein